MISGIADNVLAELYKSCRFTIFPSHYEGWGCLSLNHYVSAGYRSLLAFPPSRKREVNSPNTSIHFRCGKHTPRSNVLIFDHSYRSEREANIANRFRARSWDDIALDVVRTIKELPRSPERKDSRTKGLIEEIRLGSVYTFATAGLTVGDETSRRQLSFGKWLGWSRGMGFMDRIERCRDLRSSF